MTRTPRKTPDRARRSIAGLGSGRGRDRSSELRSDNRADGDSCARAKRSIRLALRRLATKTRIAVACSGGRDSVALATLTAPVAEELGLVLELVHVDHGLRADSALDADFVTSLAQRLRLRCHLHRVNLSPGASEGAAREARFAAFEKVFECGVAAILLAHHAADQRETLLLRILRGAGPRGLIGMRAARRGSGGIFLRPWLDLEPEDLSALSGQMTWREDPTNQSLMPLRNRLRHAIVPGVRAELGDLNARLARISRLARATSRLEDLALSSSPLLASQCAGPGWLTVCQHAVRAADPLLRRAWFAREVAARRAVIERFEAFVREATAGPIHLRAGLRAESLHGRIWLHRTDALLPPRLTLRPLVTREQVVSALADARADARFGVVAGAEPLTLGPADTALSYRPLGCSGRKRLRDQMRSVGIPRGLRSWWPMVRDAEGFVFAPWLPPTDRRRVDRRTERGWQIRWDEGPPRTTGQR